MDKLHAIGLASLALGGFLVIAYLTFSYFAIWRHEFFLVTPELGGRFVASERFNDSFLRATPFPNGTQANPAGQNATGNSSSFGGRGPPPSNLFVSVTVDPLSQVLSPTMLGILIIGIFFLLNGYVILDHSRKFDRKETRKFVISSLLTGDEKMFYDELVKNDGEATQKQLSLSTGFSAVKTYRVLKRLEGKKIVRSFPFGMTNKIMLNEAEK